jgi:cellulose synthase/poly-beta-1,6-N-acetylglucosamine synthase-like glycosyltransferase
MYHEPEDHFLDIPFCHSVCIHWLHPAAAGPPWRKIFGRRKSALPADYEPAVTLLIPAFNEADYVVAKVRNSAELNYPGEKLQIVWVTDGSTDNTSVLLNHYPGITIMHEKERRGKVHAMNRCMKTIDTPLVVFTDANTMLNGSHSRNRRALFR